MNRAMIERHLLLVLIPCHHSQARVGFDLDLADELPIPSWLRSSRRLDDLPGPDRARLLTGERQLPGRYGLHVCDLSIRNAAPTEIMTAAAAANVHHRL